MRVLLFGATGLVGRAIRDEAAGRGIKLLTPGRARCDLATPGAPAAAILDAGALDGVINAAAYTAVDQAESAPDHARAVNARAPGEMAKACAQRSIPLVHFSTDSVFSGEAAGRAYLETDPANPRSTYGRTKLEGEAAVAAAGGCAAVLRVSWVFGAHGRNFPQIMLRLAREHGRVRVVHDQFAKPTPASGAASAALDVIDALMAEPSKAGLYHYAGDRPVSRADFAREIFEAASLDIPVEPIPSSAFPSAAPRPAWAVLDTHRIHSVFGIAPADWRCELDRVIEIILHEFEQREGDET